jgi:hypothetical protein
LAFPFRSPRHARGLLTDAIIPLSVAVAKLKAGIGRFKNLIGMAALILDLSCSAKAEHPVNTVSCRDYWIIRLRG